MYANRMCIYIYIYLYIYPPAPPCGGHTAAGLKWTVSCSELFSSCSMLSAVQQLQIGDQPCGIVGTGPHKPT